MEWIKKLIFVFFLGSLCLLCGVFGALFDDLEVYYSFDNTLNDLTGNGHTATNYGATYISSGKLGGAYDFDYNSDYMLLGTDTNILGSNPDSWSYSFWFKIDDLNVRQNFLFPYYSESSGDSTFAGIIQYRGDVDPKYIKTETRYNETTETIKWYKPSFSTSNWYHAVLINDQVAGTTKFFINNVLKSSGSIPSGDYTDGGNFYLGATMYAGTLYKFLDGKIDELAIFRKALTADEISELYNSGNGIRYNDIIGTPQIQHNISNYYNTQNISIQLNTSTNTNMSYSLDNSSLIPICSNCNNSILELNNLDEGSHSILFESTDENGQVNSTSTFTIDLTVPTMNNNSIPGTINSYSLNLTNRINYTEIHTDSCMIYWSDFSNICNEGIKFFAAAGNYSYNITIIDSAGNDLTKSYSIFVNPFNYIYFKDFVRNLNLRYFTFGNYNSNNSTYVKIPFDDFGEGNHTLIFMKDGYNTKSYNFNFNKSQTVNLTLNVTPVTITMKVYDESSSSTQLKFNLSMNNVVNYTQYLNQLNFQKYYDETLTGNLTLTAESSGYSLRKVFTELSPYSTVSHTIYLLADTDSTPVIFRTQNLAQTQAIEDVVFTFTKEVSGTPAFLGQAKTDSQGYTYFNMDVLTDYEITISKAGYVSQVINSIPGKTDYTILMEEEGSTSSFLFDDFSYIIYPQTTPTSIPFNASVVVFDEANLISSMRFTVTGDNTSETQVLTNPNGGTIQFLITNTSSQYVLNLSVMREGQEYNFIKKLNYYETTSSNANVEKVAQKLKGESNNENRVFMIIIIYVVAVVLGSLFSPTIGAVCGLLPITIFAIPKVGWLTPGIAALFYVFTILGVLYFER